MTPRRGRAHGGQGGAEPRARVRLRALQVLERTLAGESQTQIAAALKISQVAVSKILRRLEDQLCREAAQTLERQRARHLLHFANQDINLAHLAQDIGYPDSTHFSHSIRRFYGLKPRAIFSGSRDLAIYRSDPGGLGANRQGRA